MMPLPISTIPERSGPALIQERIAGKIAARLGQSCQRVLMVQVLQVNEKEIDLGNALNGRHYAHPPYGMGVIKKDLERRGYVVQLVDLNYSVLDFIHKKEDVLLSVPEITAAWQEQLQKTVATFRPDVVGLSCMYAMTHGIMVRTAEFIKSLQADLPVVVGGVHATFSKEVVLRASSAIDFVALYECDVSFGELLDFAQGRVGPERVTQIATLIDDCVVALETRDTPSLDIIQTEPDYGNLPIGDYSRVGQVGIFGFLYGKQVKAGTMLANRGCRANCSFCIVRSFNGSKVRGRTINHIVDNMARLKETYGITHFTWMDDDLFYDAKRCVELFNTMTRRNLNVTWDASNGVMASSVAVHPEILASAAQSGCIALAFGIESGSERILKAIHKPCGIRHYIKVASMLENYPGIFTKGFLMLGFPNETIGEMWNTINLAKQLQFDWYSVQIVTPLPTTEMYDQIVEAEPERGTLYLGFRESDRQKRVEGSGEQRFFKLMDAKPDYIPVPEELHHIWFDADFLINYPRMFTMTDSARLKKILLFLTDVCDRRVGANPIPNLFLAVINGKLGQIQEANQRMGRALAFFDQTPYWTIRLNALRISLNDLFSQCQRAIHGG